MSHLLSLLLWAAAPQATLPQLAELNQALDANDLDAAQALLDKGLAADAEDPELLAYRAQLLARIGKPAAAIADLEHLLRIDPNDDDARLLLARMYAEVERPADAKIRLDELLARHPDDPAALAMGRGIDTGAISSPGRGWDVLLRGGVAARYDSNVALQASAAPEAGSRGTMIYEADLAAGPRWRSGDAWFLGVARLIAAFPQSDEQILRDSTPTMLQLGLAGEQAWGKVGLGVDVRYGELFTSSFQNHVQRSLGPTLWARWAASPEQTLRLLGGVDWRGPDVGVGNLTARLSIRDDLDFSQVGLTVELAGRRNASTTTPTGRFQPVDFWELGAIGVLRWELLRTEGAGTFHLEAQGDAGWRAFDTQAAVDLKESTYHVLGGIAWRLRFIEARVDYGFTTNLSNAARSFDRHQVGLTVRGWID